MTDKQFPTLEERREEIVSLVNEKGKVSTKDLAKSLATSEVTIRNDISFLARVGLLVKTHGGALAYKKALTYELPSLTKSGINHKEKEMIGRVAAKLIQPGDVVILDSGSTTYEIARNIAINDITVITNDIQIAYYLAEKTQVGLIVVGGVRAPEVFTLAGNIAIDFLKTVSADKVFLGCDAIDFNFGITNRTLEEVKVKQTMIQASKQVIAVADSSKQGKRVFIKVCDISSVDTLITDSFVCKNIDISALPIQIIIADNSKNSFQKSEKGQEK